MITAVDTETTGLWRDNLDLYDASQPHLMQLSASLVDSSRRRRASITAIMRPDGWSIEPEAERVHGISERTAHRAGVPVVGPLAVLRGFVSISTVVVAHHFEYDWKVIAAALKRAGSDGEWWRQARDKSFCTMERSAKTVGIPGTFGPEKYPSLEEAHRFLFPSTAYESRHDAEEDRDAAERIYWALMERSA